VLLLLTLPCAVTAYSGHGMGVGASRVLRSDLGGLQLSAAADELVPISKALTSPEPISVLTLDERNDGWNDVRSAIKNRQKPLAELTRSVQPIFGSLRSTSKWALLLTREVIQGTNRWTMQRSAPRSKTIGRRRTSEPYPIETYPIETTWTSTSGKLTASTGGKEAPREETMEEEVPLEEVRELERVPILANTVFTLQVRGDGWDDVRGVVRPLRQLVPQPAAVPTGGVRDEARDEGMQAEAVQAEAAQADAAQAVAAQAEAAQATLQSLGAAVKAAVDVPTATASVVSSWASLRATQLLVNAATVWVKASELLVSRR